MRARTDLWEPGASNRLGPPGRWPFSASERDGSLPSRSGVMLVGFRVGTGLQDVVH